MPNEITKEAIIEVQDLAFAAAGDYAKAKGIKRGLVKEQHAGIMVHALKELGLLNESDPLVLAKAFFVLCKLENGSQLRQDLIKAGLIGKETAMVDEYIIQ